jgi:hypothetical protein
MYYGVPGSGKSYLLMRFQEWCDQRRVPWAEVNLAVQGQSYLALVELAACLEKKHGIRFASFKRVVVALRAQPTRDLTAIEIAAGTKSLRQGFDVALDALGLLPIVSTLAMGVKVGIRGAGLAYRTLMEENWDFRDLVLRLDGHEELLDLVECTAEALQEKLVPRFAADLEKSLPARENCAVRGVLFFDRHEALWCNAHGGAKSEDAWLGELREHADGRGVLMVMAGRNALDWPANWKAPNEKGVHAWLEEHRLDGLSELDAEKYLLEAWPESPATRPENR